QKWHAGFCQWSQILQHWRCRHGAAEDWILGVNTGDFFRVGNRPCVNVSRGPAGAFHDRSFGEAVVGEMFVNGVPVSELWAVGVVGDWTGDDVEALSQQFQVNQRVSGNEAGAEDP